MTELLPKRAKDERHPKKIFIDRIMNLLADQRELSSKTIYWNKLLTEPITGKEN